MKASGAAAVLTVVSVFLASPYAACAQDSPKESARIFDGSTIVESRDYTGWSVRADMGTMDSPTISGHIAAAEGTGDSIQVLVLTESDYQNWKEHLAVTPIYNSAPVTTADVSVKLPESGTYYVVLSNPSADPSSNTVEGDLTLSWQPSSATQDPGTLKTPELPTEKKPSSRGMFLKLLGVVVAGAFAGGAL
jgi:hypothetical protein